MSMDPDEFKMYEKRPTGYYGQDFHPMLYEMVQHQQQQQQQQARRPPRQSKKPRRIASSHEQYLALVVDPETQQIICRSSPEFEHIKNEILSPALKKLDNYIRGNPQSKVSRKNDSRPELQHVLMTTVKPQTSNKRRRAGNDRDVSDSGSQKELSRHTQPDESDAECNSLVRLRVDEKIEWEKWFYNAFRAVQQVSCRVIAKEWIKTIHPKKQSTHPYNGKNPKTGENGGSDSTKPPYWPKGVIHREPDHINKEARTKLLVHLLMNTPHQEMSLSGDPKSDKEVNAETLKKSLEQKKLERGMNDLRKKFSIVEQIIETRTTLEQYEAGGLNPDTIIHVVDYSDYVRPSKNGDDSDELVDERLELADDRGISEQPDEKEDYVLVDKCKRESVTGAKIDVRSQDRQTSNIGLEAAQRSNQQPLRNEMCQHSNDIITQQVPQQGWTTNLKLNPNIHPPMLLDYSDFGSSLPGDECTISNAQLPTVHEMSHLRATYPGYNLGPQMNSQMEMSNHCTNQCMVSPTLMSNMNSGTYANRPFGNVSHHPTYLDPSQTVQFSKHDNFITDVAEQRSIPYRDNNQQYETYMGSTVHNQDILHRDYLDM